MIFYHQTLWAACDLDINQPSLPPRQTIHHHSQDNCCIQSLMHHSLDKHCCPTCRCSEKIYCKITNLMPLLLKSYIINMNLCSRKLSILPQNYYCSTVTFFSSLAISHVAACPIFHSSAHATSANWHCRNARENVSESFNSQQVLLQKTHKIVKLHACIQTMH